jgi:hypothetical protein
MKNILYDIGCGRELQCMEEARSILIPVITKIGMLPANRSG